MFKLYKTEIEIFHKMGFLCKILKFFFHIYFDIYPLLRFRRRKCNCHSRRYATPTLLDRSNHLRNTKMWKSVRQEKISCCTDAEQQRFTLKFFSEFFAIEAHLISSTAQIYYMKFSLVSFFLSAIFCNRFIFHKIFVSRNAYIMLYVFLSYVLNEIKMFLSIMKKILILMPNKTK